MKEKNKTASDAFVRVLDAKISSLLNPTSEYLDALEHELQKWLEQIKEYRARRGK